MTHISWHIFSCILGFIMFFWHISIIFAQNIKQDTSALHNLPEDFFTVDRPGLADLPYTISRGNYQFEIGTDYIFRGNDRIWQMPNFLLRTGLAKNIEIHFGTQYWVTQTLPTPTEGYAEKHGFSSFMAGIKYAFYKSKNGAFDGAFVTDFNIALSDINKVEGFRRFYGSTQFTLECNSKLSERFSFNYLTSYQVSQYQLENVWSYAFCLDISLNKRWGLFVENFDYFSQENEPEIGFDGGFLYLLTPYIQLDVNGGVSRYTTDYYNFVGIGISFRLDTKKAKKRVTRLKF
jgi:hypothetical protein